MLAHIKDDFSWKFVICIFVLYAIIFVIFDEHFKIFEALSKLIF